MVHSSLKQYKVFLGIDWADAKHDICLQVQGEDSRKFSILPHNPKDIEQWVLELKKKYKGPIAVAIELSKGPIVYALQKYDFFVFFPINPTTLAKYRNAFKPSRAKDDPTDAELALDLMLNYPERFKPLRPQSDGMRKLMYLVEQRRKIVGDKRRFVNRLINTLKQYYPQPLEWFCHRDTVLFCKFISKWPNLQSLKRARTKTVESFLYAHNSRSKKRIDYLVNGIKDAIPLTNDNAVIQPHELYAVSHVEQIHTAIQAINRFDEAIEQLSESHPDFNLYKDLPGAGPCSVSRLLVAFGEQRERFNNAMEVQQCSGIAPVTERSGQKEWIHWRWQCSKFLRQTFIEWSAKTIDKSYWAGLYYHRKRANGSSHQAAVRALAFKWIRILYRCWKNKKPYDEVIYLNALKARGSSLLVD